MIEYPGIGQGHWKKLVWKLIIACILDTYSNIVSVFKHFHHITISMMCICSKMATSFGNTIKNRCGKPTPETAFLEDIMEQGSPFQVVPSNVRLANQVDFMRRLKNLHFSELHLHFYMVLPRPLPTYTNLDIHWLKWGITVFWCGYKYYGGMEPD